MSGLCLALQAGIAISQLALAIGKCLGHDQFANGGVMAHVRGGDVGVDDCQQGDRIDLSTVQALL